MNLIYNPNTIEYPDCEDCCLFRTCRDCVGGLAPPCWELVVSGVENGSFVLSAGCPSEFSSCGSEIDSCSCAFNGVFILPTRTGVLPQICPYRYAFYSYAFCNEYFNAYQINLGLISGTQWYIDFRVFRALGPIGGEAIAIYLNDNFNCVGPNVFYKKIRTIPPALSLAERVCSFPDTISVEPINC